MRRLWFASVVLLVSSRMPLAGGQTPAPPVGAAVAIVGVTLVPMDQARVVTSRTVLIRDGSIAAIVPEDALLPAGVFRIDGHGRYLLPGLADMHVHLQPTDPTGINRRMLDLFLANGITTVRIMIGSPYILELRDAIGRGRVRGPTVITSGPVIDGPDSQWGSAAAVVTTADQADRIVAAQRGAGYDFLKIYSRLSRAAYLEVMSAAKRRGMAVAGHVPVSITVDDALEARQSSIEHLLGYLDAIESEGSPVRGRGGWQYRLQAFAHVDAARIPVIAARTAAAGVWNCPTFVAMEKWVPPEEARRLLEREEMRLAPATLLERWFPWRGFRLQRFGPEEFALADRARAIYLTLLAALRDAHAGLLVGTDTPSPLVVPGFSVHEELQNFVEAGFTPFEALTAATRAPAQFLGQSGTFGVIAVGARADLVLLDANPLENVANAQHIAGVIVRGEWMSKDALDARIAGPALTP